MDLEILGSTKHFRKIGNSKIFKRNNFNVYRIKFQEEITFFLKNVYIMLFIRKITQI